MKNSYINHFFDRNKKSVPEIKSILGDLIKDLSSKRNHIRGENSNDSDREMRERLGVPPKAMLLDIDNIPENVPPIIKSVFDKLKVLKVTGKLDDLTPEEFDNIISGEFSNVLGEPAEEEVIKKDGIIIDRKIWKINETEQFSKVSSRPNKNNKLDKRTLKLVEAELDDAIETEDYERATELRDEIKKLKSKKSADSQTFNKNNKKIEK